MKGELEVPGSLFSGRSVDEKRKGARQLLRVTSKSSYVYAYSVARR